MRIDHINWQSSNNIARQKLHIKRKILYETAKHSVDWTTLITFLGLEQAVMPDLCGVDDDDDGDL